MKLTGLSCRIFYEKWRYVLVHSHFIFSNAGVGTSVFIPNTADVELTPVCCKRETHEQSSWSLLSSSITACCSHDSRGFGGILIRADVLLLSISTYKLGARNEQRKIRKMDSKLKVCLVKYCLVQWKNKINTLTLQMVFFTTLPKSCVWERCLKTPPIILISQVGSLSKTFGRFCDAAPKTRVAVLPVLVEGCNAPWHRAARSCFLIVLQFAKKYDRFSLSVTSLFAT